MDYRKNFAKTIWELRKQYGYTQKEVAEKLGVVYQSYQSYELGRSFPEVEKFVALAELYDVSLEYLIGKKEF